MFFLFLLPFFFFFFFREFHYTLLNAAQKPQNPFSSCPPYRSILVYHETILPVYEVRTVPVFR